MSLDPVTAGLDLARTAINAIWPDQTEQQKTQLNAALAIVQGQLAVNQAEATSSSVFVAGWRPAVGWVCATALAWQFVVRPAAMTVAAIVGYPLPVLPGVDSALWELLFGMLGFGGLRTFEKLKGVAS